ncbi:EAL domain-containing protein [Pseudomonas putida]|uniref:EAL domain-containing protein n=1 Tax=Pseudomonas putida TaxID=303 RepID=UPI0005BDF55E|nr:EAL domain-containing protein [Pseudomonas putida]
MKRSTIMRRGLVLSFLAVAVPVVFTAVLGWMLTIQSTKARLTTLAQIASDRAGSTFEQASQALKSIALTDLPPCSPEGIDQMRIVAMNTFSVESVGYEEDVFACTSWGPTEPRRDTWPEDFVTDDGVKVSIGVQSDSERLKPMLALQYAAFNVLIDPEQFREVALDEGIRVAVGTRQGRALGPTTPNTAHFLALVHAGPTHGLKDGFLYTLVPQRNFTVVAAIPRQQLLSSLWQHQLYLLPVTLIIAAWLLSAVLRSWRRKLSPLAALERAVRRQEFQVHYQPLIEIESKRCVGAEALVRWRKPNGEMVPPDHFIPLAEESGLIMPITDQVIATSLHDLGEMLVADRSLHIAINLAAADVCSGRFLPILQREIAKADVQPQQIWLEVTERSFINAEAARKTIEQARQAGFIVALDDFGTGYSSLQYLQQLSLDVLKIDRSFIDNIGKPDGRDSLVSHVIEMGLALRLALVAEGVETNAQLAFLSENQVRYAQGWLFAKAMDCHQFVQFYRQQGAMLSTDTQVPT